MKHRNSHHPSLKVIPYPFSRSIYIYIYIYVKVINFFYKRKYDFFFKSAILDKEKKDGERAFLEQNH